MNLLYESEVWEHTDNKLMTGTDSDIVEDSDKREYNILVLKLAQEPIPNEEAQEMVS